MGVEDIHPITEGVCRPVQVKIGQSTAGLGS